MHPLAKAIGICVVYGISSISFSFAAKYLFKILRFELIPIVIEFSLIDY